MNARKRWTEPELPIGPTDLALIAETWETPKDRVPPVDTLSATLPLDLVALYADPEPIIGFWGRKTCA